MVNKFYRGVEIRINTEKVDEKNSADDIVKFKTTNGEVFSQKIHIVKDDKELSDFMKTNNDKGVIPLKMGAKTVFTPNILKEIPNAQIESIEKSSVGRATSIENISSFSELIKLLGTIFIRLVQMIIAPLVFTTLVVGIAKMGDTAMIGRVGGKAMLWFISASLISLLLAWLS